MLFRRRSLVTRTSWQTSPYSYDGRFEKHASGAPGDGNLAVQPDLFLRLYLLFSVTMILDFFLTKNPYSALHSGRAAASSGIVSEAFLVSPAYLVAASLTLATLYSRKVFLHPGVLLAIALSLMSGIYNGVLLAHPVTYIYNSLTFMLTSSLAIATRKRSARSSTGVWRVFLRLLTAALVVGLLLALAFPNRFGLVTFSFSRLERGEVVLWSVLGMYALYPAMSIIEFRRSGSARYIVLSLAMSAVIVSVAYRAPAVISVLPFFVYAIFNRRFMPKLVIGGLTVVSLLLFGRLIVDFLRGSPLGSSADPTSGRAALWIYHWETFLSSPVFGAGPAFINRLGGYTGGALSEVGALSWFSENGFIFGCIMVSFVVRAVARGIKVLARGSLTTDLELLFALVVLSLVPNLLQAHGRILNADDLIFWFGVFYLSTSVSHDATKSHCGAA